jgi:hypothetical protein
MLEGDGFVILQQNIRTQPALNGRLLRVADQVRAIGHDPHLNGFAPAYGLRPLT